MFFLTAFVGDYCLFDNEPYSSFDFSKSAVDLLVSQYGDSVYGFIVTAFDDGLVHVVYCFGG